MPTQNLCEEKYFLGPWLSKLGPSTLQQQCICFDVWLDWSSPAQCLCKPSDHCKRGSPHSDRHLCSVQSLSCCKLFPLAKLSSPTQLSKDREKVVNNSKTRVNKGKKRRQENASSFDNGNMWGMKKIYIVSNCPETGQAIRNVRIIVITQLKMVKPLAFWLWNLYNLWYTDLERTIYINFVDSKHLSKMLKIDNKSIQDIICTILINSRQQIYWSYQNIMPK